VSTGNEIYLVDGRKHYMATIVIEGPENDQFMPVSIHTPKFYPMFKKLLSVSREDLLRYKYSSLFLLLLVHTGPAHACMKNGFIRMEIYHHCNTPDTVKPAQHKQQQTSGSTFQVSQTGQSVMVRGEVINYYLSANNLGPAAAPNALITDVIPTALVNVSWTAVASGGAKINGNSSGTGNVAVQTSLPVTNYGGVQIAVTGTVSQTAAAGPITNVAQVSAPGSPTATSNPIVSVITSLADMGIRKTAPSTVVAGQVISYQLEVGNAGPTNANNTIVTDHLPANLLNPATTITSVSGGAGSIQLNMVNGVMKATIGSFPAGAKAILSITATTSDTGLLRNTATISAPAGVTDPDSINNHSTTLTQVLLKAPPAVSKSVSPASGNNETRATMTGTLPVNSKGASGMNLNELPRPEMADSRRHP
jgi:uncharacterized repeat protein (TIGR01451 family)